MNTDGSCLTTVDETGGARAPSGVAAERTTLRCSRTRFPIWTAGRPRGGAHRANRPVGQLVHRFRHADGRHSRGASRVRGPVLVSLAVWTLLFRDTSSASTPMLIEPPPAVGPAITSDATRVARCARASGERGSRSSDFRPAGGRSTGHAG